MDDLISRQDVIDMIMGDGIYCDTDDDKKYSVERIMALPTAEPDVIHCKECVYYENETHGLCDLGGEWAPDDYCSYGRRPKHG